MTLQIEKDRTNMAHLGGLPGEKPALFWQHSLGLQICIWTNHNTSGSMFFAQVRCFAIMHSAMSGENQTQNLRMNTSYQLSSRDMEGWCFGLVLQAQDLGTLQSLSGQWSLCIPKCSRVSLGQALTARQMASHLSQATCRNMFPPTHHQIRTKWLEKKIIKVL